ncbi:RHS repeat domain-containing protein [Ruminococcus sp.]|uniref:RHS repeat domain-containing protein n=1 Tax=Ruminococcus sp. TaxID=41978 RepID=UPI00388ED81D
MNLFQTLYPSSKYGLTGESAQKYPYVFTDSDGTEHYFKKVTENNKTKYLDEDGLNLELTIKGSGNWSDNTLENDDYYVITDKDKNRITFFSDGSLRTEKDSYNQKSQQRYNAPDSDIKWVEDPSNNRITISQKNNNDYVTAYRDADNRIISIDYATFGNTTACLRRIHRTDNTYIEFTYYGNGLLESISDVDGYKIEIKYQNSAVSEIVEKGTAGSEGNKITYDRSQYNTTVKKTSGNDGIMGTSDDITTTYQFDNCGRTKSVQTETENEEDLGAANYEYTSGTPNSSGSNIHKLNRITSEHYIGANTYNYLKNHGFETSSGWTNSVWHGSNSFTGTYDQSQKTYGKKSYKIQSTSYNNTSAGRAYQDITTLEPGSTYTLSGYIKVTELSGNQSVSGAVIDATSFNRDSSTPDYYSEYINEVTDPAINNGWRRVSISFTVPDDSYKIRVNIALRAAIGTAYFDGIQLEKANTAGSYNLLENSSFETSESNSRPLSWSNYVNMAFSWASTNDGCRTTQKRHAYQSFKINGEVQKNKYISQIVPISGSENDTYIVGGWAKADSVALDDNNVRKFKISIEIHYSDGSDIFKDSADFNPTISDWQFVSKAFNLSDETSANKTPVSIEIFLNYSKQGNAAYFDNISLVKEPSQSYTYDSKGNLLSVVSNAEQCSTMEYNGDNKLTKAIDAKGYKYTYTYNEKGKVDVATTELGSKYKYQYDDHGNVKEVEGESKYGDHKVKCEETIGYDEAQNSEYYNVIFYDQRHNASNSVFNSKTGKLKSTTDNYGVVTNYEYEPSNDLLISVTKHKNQSTSPSEPTEPIDATEPSEAVSYQYSESNNWMNYKYLTDINTSTSHYHFGYDTFGNKTSTKVGERTLADYTYNGSGSLTGMHYGNGNSISYEYDKYGNICKKVLNNEPSSTPSYEAFADNTGTITKSIDNVNHLQYDDVYDSTNRLINSTITDTSTNKRKAMYEYDFDLNNNISKFTVLTPNGSNTITYNYRENNLYRNTALQNGSTIDYSYDYLGRPNKTTVNIDDNTHIENIYTYLDSPISGYTTTILEKEKLGTKEYKYEYDKNGNIIKISQKDNNNAYFDLESYTYDYLGQLTQVDYWINHKRIKYEYANGGNLAAESIYNVSGTAETLVTTNNYSYNDTNWGDLLTNYNNNTITYDEIGNPLNYRDGISFTWSNGRQLQSYTKNNSTIDYTYDDSGMRLSKDVGNTHYTYLYKNGLLLQETIGEKILDYSYSAGGQIISVCYRESANIEEGSYYYYALNNRGDVIGLYDDTGVLCANYSYDVWGKPIAVTDASGTVISNPNDIANIQSLRYRSYYYDTDSGFYYLQSRYYDPVTHRYINTDGYVYTGSGILGFNMFSYCNNNPVIYYDSNGTNGIPVTINEGQKWLASGLPCPFTIMDISLAQRNGAQANDVFFYDYSYTYNYGGISYESSMSTGKIYYADNVSYATTSKKYEISAYSYPNTVTSFSGEHIEGLDTVTMGVRFGDLTLFSGIDGNNHLIGWDYSVEYDNNNLGTASGTLKIDNDTYDTMQKAVACVAIIAAAAVVSYFCPPVGLAIGASGGAVGGLAF